MQRARAESFRALHSPDAPILVLPNAWDAGSAKMLAQAGFPAIATTSAGVAFSAGIPDGGHIRRDAMIDAIASIIRCTARAVATRHRASASPAASTPCSAVKVS